jgi:hypothetical protein
MIHNATGEFDFKGLHLSTPTPVHGGTMYTKILSQSDEPLFIYTPRCTTKGGVVTSGAKRYMDIVYTRDNQNMLDWATGLEEAVTGMLYERRADWFTEDLEMDDIQSVFIPMIKSYKSHHVSRVYLSQGRQKLTAASVQVYDENETPCDVGDIKEGVDMIAILEVQGVRFSSKSFQFNLGVKQVMIFNKKNAFSQCMIRQEPEVVEVEVPEPEDTVSIRPYIMDRLRNRGTRSN